MRALVKTAKGPGNIEVREVPKPTIPTDDWVLIKVKAAGVCGTDLHIWHDEFNYWPPVILGHEFSGCIAEVGPMVTDFKSGDRVVAEPHAMACGKCPLCRQGKVQLCRSKRSPGWGIDGAIASYVVMPEMLLHRIPEGIPYTLAALAEPLAIVIHQITERVRLECQDVVVITGSGPMGILSAFVASRMGAGMVVMTGISTGEHMRFPIARKLGTDIIINVEHEDPVVRVMELTRGKGADLVIETSGATPAIAQAVAMARICGQITAIGIPGADTTPIPYKAAMIKALDLHFNMSSSYSSWDKALGMIESHGDELESVVTISRDIGDWESVFRSMEEEKTVKPVFVIPSSQ